MTENLIGKTRIELVELCESLGESSYRADQLMRWLYHDRVGSIDAMTNLPREFRALLATEAAIRRPEPVRTESSELDGSLKLLLRLESGHSVETVLLPAHDRLTACLSTQVGCSLGCGFCRTGEMGFVRNLDASEIVGQLLAAAGESERRISNVVLMGMGEPLLNLDNVVRAARIFRDEKIFAIGSRKLTVSTAGIVKGLRKIASLRPELMFGVSVSLNAPDQELREELMPSATTNPLDELIPAAASLARRGRRGLTFEYVLLGGVNDRQSHARRLARLIRDINCKVNLIPFNPYPGAGFVRSSQKSTADFLRILVDNHVPATIRASLGKDILGACGQLATGEKRH